MEMDASITLNGLGINKGKVIILMMSIQMSKVEKSAGIKESKIFVNKNEAYQWVTDNYPNSFGLGEFDADEQTWFKYKMIVEVSSQTA